MTDTGHGIRLAIALSLITVVGCEADRRTASDLAPGALPLVASRVSGEAAARLRPDGLFDLGAPAPGARPEINEARARELALAFARYHGPSMRPVLEADHGAPIDFKSLATCPRVYYAASPVEPLAPHLPSYYHRLFGPRWLVSLCSAAGAPAISVAVSAYATEVQIVNGALVYGGDSPRGEEFEVLGIPSGLGALPITPENAVLLATNAARGHTVARVSRLVMPLPSAYYAQTAHWELELDSPASLTATTTDGSHAGLTISRVFVGLRHFREGNQVRPPDAAGGREITFEWREPAREGMTQTQIEALPRHLATARLANGFGPALTSLIDVSNQR